MDPADDLLARITEYTGGEIDKRDFQEPRPSPPPETLRLVGSL
jgi:hypothetical protein